MPQKIDAVSVAGLAASADLRLSAVQAELAQQRRLRTEQLDELALDAAESVAIGDEPRLQVIRVLRMAAESGLGEIDAALERLRDGVYGSCERCTEPIQWERLEVLPTARLCTPCQSLVESGRSRNQRPVRARPAAALGEWRA
jgi:RNA polymerase-binding transcription factor DksA